MSWLRKLVEIYEMEPGKRGQDFYTEGFGHSKSKFISARCKILAHSWLLVLESMKSPKAVIDTDQFVMLVSEINYCLNGLFRMLENHDGSLYS